MAARELTLEGVRIRYPNFQGRADTFNQAGRRNFVVLLDDDTASAMLKEGWNVKTLAPRDETDTPQAIMKVNVKYDGKGAPPQVYLITTRGKTLLDENSARLIDIAEIENVDMIIRPWRYDINGSQGISAYLKSIYVTMHEDDLARKYRDVADARAAMAYDPAENPDENSDDPDEEEPPF
jgi:hypothetical protein